MDFKFTSCELSVLFSLDVGNCPAKVLFSVIYANMFTFCLLRLPSEGYNFEKLLLMIFDHLKIV